MLGRGEGGEGDRGVEGKKKKSREKTSTSKAKKKEKLTFRSSHLHTCFKVNLETITNKVILQKISEFLV